MKFIALESLAFGVFATSAAAQLVPLRLPPAVSEAGPTEPTEISRKMEALEVAGLKVPPSGLQESVILSARQPWKNSRTFVDFTRAIGYSTRGNFVAVAAVPQMSTIYSTPPGAELVWNADPSKRHIIDCEVSGDARQIRFRWGDKPEGPASLAAGGMASPIMQSLATNVQPSAAPSEVQGEATATVVNGRVSTVLPTGVAGSVRISADKDWQFRSCEITPVAI